MVYLNVNNGTALADLTLIHKGQDFGDGLKEHDGQDTLVRQLGGVVNYLP